MAIDWASSSEEEFPDLDVVLARAKANKSKAEEQTLTPPRRSADRTRASRARKDSSPAPGDEELSPPRKEVVPTRTVVRRRRLGPKTGGALSEPLSDQKQERKSREDGPSEKASNTASRIRVRALRPPQGTSKAREDREKIETGSEDDSDSYDGMSDFIVHTDDDSDFCSDSNSRPKTKNTLPDMPGSRAARPPSRAVKDSIPKKDAKATSTLKLPPVADTTSRKHHGTPAGESLSDALGRLDISASSSAPERQQTPPNTPPKKNSGKKTLVSPQKLAAVPQTPHRPSMDLFWDQEFFNEWTEEHSPRKLFLPKVSKTPAKSSPAKEEKTKAAAGRTAKKHFENSKRQLAESFLRELDDVITNGRIASLAASTGGVKIQWSKTLNTTAGRANWKRETIRAAGGDGGGPTTVRHHASVELAEKVISDEDRLLNVLAHEFCHLANFMITGMTTNPHGKEFKAWAAKVSRAFADRGIEVTTKHSYEIDFKYVWECGECALEYKRHSKSINPERHRCGACKGTLLQTRPVPRGGGRVAAGAAGGSGEGGQAKGPAPKKEPSGYQRFVKEQMRVVREENPGTPQKDMMRLVAEKWARTRGDKAKGKMSARSESREASVESMAAQLDDLVL